MVFLFFWFLTLYCLPPTEVGIISHLIYRQISTDFAPITTLSSQKVIHIIHNFKKLFSGFLRFSPSCLHVIYILSTLYFYEFTPISWNLSPFWTSFLPKISGFTHLSTKLSTLSTKLSPFSVKVLYRSYPHFYPHYPQIQNCIFF